MKKWTIEDSNELYNISGWGTSYFGINDKGDIYVTPCKDNVQIDLHDVLDELALRDVTPPVLLRFPDILDNRIEKTWSCFRKASEEYGFKGENFIIYPIKVNQMQPVVEEIISHGRKFNLGLEAGSKPELHAVIAVQCQSDSLIICNGYKDQSYIELALLAQKMGKRIFIVVEKLNELDTISRAAKKLGVKPNLGIRIKLASSGSGKWEESGGDASKFGLTSSELLTALEILEKKGMKDCLRLIHFHIGSQITKIRRIQTALKEASLRRRPRRRLRRHALAQQRKLRQLLNPGIRQRLHLHLRRGGRPLRHTAPQPHHRERPLAVGTPLGARHRRARNGVAARDGRGLRA